MGQHFLGQNDGTPVLRSVCVWQMGQHLRGVLSGKVGTGMCGVLCFYLYQLRWLHQVLLCFSTYANCARLWRPVPGMWIVIFLPMPTVTTCVGYVNCYICQLRRANRVIFLPVLTVPGALVLFFYLCQLSGRNTTPCTTSTGRHSWHR